MSLEPDICILNLYDGEGRMGLHQDKDEGARSLEAGVPVVSVSIGDTARFLFGGTRRRDPIATLMLESGDAFVFGGDARLRYHGVSLNPSANRATCAWLRRTDQPDISTVRRRVGDPDYRDVTRMATRLLRARPSGVELSAIGC